eukprot:GHVS01014937.1.p1 GENE.GHVS01014937.1~~GHVS01014937.1.p1  ORF type:complete len:431 (-),score=99.69 GHVS01014937.1:120-1412(-)
MAVLASSTKEGPTSAPRRSSFSPELQPFLSSSCKFSSKRTFTLYSKHCNPLYRLDVLPFIFLYVVCILFLIHSQISPPPSPLLPYPPHPQMFHLPISMLHVCVCLFDGGSSVGAYMSVVFCRFVCSLLFTDLPRLFTRYATDYQLPTLALALLLTATQPTYAACQQHLDFSGDKPRNRSGDLLSCHEHSTRTCCRRHHTEKIALQLASLDDISDNCKRSTEAVWCSICDGEVGEGKFSHSKSTVRLCEAFCQKWYDACRDDYFSPGGPGAASVEPCGLSHLACSRLADITKNASDFCRLSGYEVSPAPPEIMSCYAGVPAALLYGSAPPPPPSYKGSSGSSRSRVGLIWNELSQPLVLAVVVVLLYALSKLRHMIMRRPAGGEEVWHGPGYRLGCDELLAGRQLAEGTEQMEEMEVPAPSLWRRRTPDGL